MGKTVNCCPLAATVALVILVLFPVRSWSREDAYSSLNEANCCKDAEFKRFDDIDYDSFMSLMGRRSAAQPNRQMDHIFASLQERRRRVACWLACADEKSRMRRGRLVSQGRPKQETP